MAVNIKLIALLANKLNIVMVCSIEIILGLLISIIICIFCGDNILKNTATADWLYFGLSGLLAYGAASYFSFLHIKYVGEEKNALLSPLITALTILSSWNFLNEPLQWHKTVGILLVIIPIFFYEIKFKSHKIRIPKLTEILILLALVGSIVISILLVRVQINKSILSPFSIIAIRYVGSLPLCFFLYKTSPINLIRLSKRDWLLLIGNALLVTIAINYLWIQSNKQLSNFFLQTIIALLPLVVGLMNFSISSYRPSLLFILTCLSSIIGIAILCS